MIGELSNLRYRTKGTMLVKTCYAYLLPALRKWCFLGPLSDRDVVIDMIDVVILCSILVCAVHLRLEDLLAVFLVGIVHGLVFSIFCLVQSLV